jgi:hypothetical protein
MNKEPCSRYWKEERCIQNFGRTDLMEEIAWKTFAFMRLYYKNGSAISKCGTDLFGSEEGALTRYSKRG